MMSQKDFLIGLQPSSRNRKTLQQAFNPVYTHLSQLFELFHLHSNMFYVKIWEKIQKREKREDKENFRI